MAGYIIVYNSKLFGSVWLVLVAPKKTGAGAAITNSEWNAQ